MTVALFKKGDGTLSDLLKQLPEFYDKLATDPLYKRYAAPNEPRGSHCVRQGELVI